MLDRADIELKTQLKRRIMDEDKKVEDGENTNQESKVGSQGDGNKQAEGSQGEDRKEEIADAKAVATENKGDDEPGETSAA